MPSQWCATSNGTAPSLEHEQNSGRWTGPTRCGRESGAGTPLMLAADKARSMSRQYSAFSSISAAASRDAAASIPPKARLSHPSKLRSMTSGVLTECCRGVSAIAWTGIGDCPRPTAQNYHAPALRNAGDTTT